LSYLQRCAKCIQVAFYDLEDGEPLRLSESDSVPGRQVQRRNHVYRILGDGQGVGDVVCCMNHIDKRDC